MGDCHGEYQGVPIDCDDVPRARQSLRLRCFVALLVESFFACADHGQHIFGGQVDLSNSMILCVAQVDEVVAFAEDVTQALWVMELGLKVLSIDEADLSISDLLFKLHGFFINYDDSVVGCVRHDDQVPVQVSLLLDAQNFSWVPKVLLPSRLLFCALTDGLVDLLSFLFDGFLFFWLPVDDSVVIELIIVKVVCNR